jgi:hypothetical protein
MEVNMFRCISNYFNNIARWESIRERKKALLKRRRSEREHYSKIYWANKKEQEEAQRIARAVVQELKDSGIIPK